jgi:hypothetical protein
MGVWKSVKKTLDPKKNGVSKGFKKAFSEETWKPVGKVTKKIASDAGKGALSVGGNVGKEILSIGKLGLDATKSLLGAIPQLTQMLPLLLMGGIVLAILFFIR